MNPILNIAIRVARKGGDILVQYYDRHKTNYEHKILKKDLINKIIATSEKLMVDIIYKSYPCHSIITYHKKLKILKNTKIIWQINALDGIKNFENNLPHFCISIAIIIRNITEISVIYDPLKNELFTAVKGQGAQLNGYRMRCKNTNVLNKSIVGLIHPYDNNKFKNYLFKIITLLLLDKVKLRCSGCISLDYAYVAVGRLDYLFNFNVKPLSFSAGYLQIKESGGLITDVHGGHDYISSGSMLIGNPKLMRIILVTIRKLLKNDITYSI